MRSRVTSLCLTGVRPFSSPWGHTSARSVTCRNLSTADSQQHASPEDTARSAGTSKAKNRVIEQKFTNISYSPWRMNLIAKQLRRLDAQEAIAQGDMSPKKGGRIASSLIQKAADRAQRTFGVHASELLVDQIFVTQGPGKKKLKIMGRGKTGLQFVRSSHLNIKLLVMDFDQLITDAKTDSEKRRWQHLEKKSKAMRAKMVTADDDSTPKKAWEL